jgi:high affinity sulfate transporter 1
MPTSQSPLFASKTPATVLFRWLPILALLRAYQPRWLLSDMIAGFALTAILVPAGMGYAAASGLPVIYGLYASITPLLIYAIFGSSRILILGPDSGLIALIAATVLPLAGGNPDKAVIFAGMLAILSGLLCILVGLCKFAFITDLLSKPIRSGYLNGIAITVLIGQLPKLLGFSVKANSLQQEINLLWQGIWAGRANIAACAIGLCCLSIIFICKRFLPKIPGVLIAVILATVIVESFDLAFRFHLAVVGSLPQGLPQFRIPVVSWFEVKALFAGAVAIALVSFADMSVLSRTFALRGGYQVNGNQELIALGMANIVCGLFQGFCVTSSASRTPVAEDAGAKTQIAAVVGALCVSLLLIFAPNLLKNVPHAALAAVVISACISLLDIRGLWRLYALRRSEFFLSLLCLLAVALFGVIQGIFLAVVLALLIFIWRAWHPYTAVLGRVDGMKGYHDITRHPEGRLIPGLVIFRWDAPLFFANAEIFHEQILQAVTNAPTLTKRVLVAAEPVTDVDITAADSLTELINSLQQAGIELCFAEMKGPVKDQLKLYGLFSRLGDGNFFPTIGQAVDDYLLDHQVSWRDWDE